MARRRTPTSNELAADPGTAWARDVVEGRIVAGDLMIRACDRHLRDIVDGGKRGLHWRPEKAQHALGFFPAVLSVTAGAKVGEPFNLPSYTAFAVASLFGWRRDNGLRRFRSAWFELGKGQIKSPLMAAIGLYIMGFNAIARSEVYAIAKDRNQANVLFRDAVAMCKANIPGTPDGSTDSIESRGEVIIRGVGDNAWKIEHPSTGSKFQALAGDEAVSGPRPSAVLADEIHEWKSGAAIENWQAGLAKMPGDPLMMLGTNTPAADQIVGTEYSELYQRILRGEIEDDTAFAVIARVDATDDPLKDESCWQKSLPCLGITYPIDNVRDEVKAAQQRIAKSLTVKRLFFGIPVGSSEYWIDLDAWEAVQGRVDEEKMRGAPCWLSMDLSQKNDLTALGATWKPEGDRPHAKLWYWKPRDGDGGLVEGSKRDGAQYVEWAEAGLLEAVPGRSIDYDFVAVQVQKICAVHNVVLMAFDPAHISEFRKACDRIGFATWIWAGPDEPEGVGLKMVIHSQGRAGMHSTKALWMPRSLQTLEDQILSNGIVVDESPVTKYCAGNARVEADAQGNRYLDKKRSRGRIDGLVALAMGAGAATLGAEKERSFWEAA